MTWNALWSPASVCLSMATRLHYCMDPDETWESGWGCHLVVHCWAYLQSVHRLHCYGNVTRTLVTRLPPPSDMKTSDLPSLPHLAGDSRILDSTSRAPAASSKSPSFYKQSQFPFNSTAKIAPRIYQNSPFWAQKLKKNSGPPPPSGEGDISASLSAPSASRSRRQSSSPASVFLKLGSSAT